MNKASHTHFGGTETENIEIEKARVVVLPLCYENAPSYGTGSQAGPYHILNASEQLESLDEEALVEWARIPIHTLEPFSPPSDPERAVIQIKKKAEKVIRKKQFLLSLGGDHAISLGPIMAAADTYPDLGVVQIDAHLDLRDEWNGSRYNHACVMRRVHGDIKIPVVPIGIRSFSVEEAEYVKKNKLTVLYAHEIDAFDTSWAAGALDLLPEHVYITIDLDGLDPAVIPGTGTPEPGGLSYRQLVHLIKTIGINRNVIGADVTELAKIKGSQVSEFTAAKIVTKILVYCL
jgi:agmatinase